MAGDDGSEPATGHPSRYLIDVCSINEIDGTYRNGQPSIYTPDEQERVWDALVKLFSCGRAAMVSYAKTELRSWNPDGYKRLRGFKAVRETNAVIAKYQEVVRRFPGWVDEDGDPADPWMVAFAAEQDWQIVTEEKRLADQRIKRRRPKIPDAADAFGVQCVKMAELIRNEKWL